MDGVSNIWPTIINDNHRRIDYHGHDLNRKTKQNEIIFEILFDEMTKNHHDDIQ